MGSNRIRNKKDKEPSVKIYELLQKHSRLPSHKELQLRTKEPTWENRDFWHDLDETFKVYRYHCHPRDRARIISEITRRIMDTAESRRPFEILDIGTGKGENILDIMASLFMQNRRPSALDIVEPSLMARECALQLLPRYEYGGCLRNAFSTLEETEERTYDAITLYNAIFYFEPLEESVVYFLHRLKQGGILIFLYANGFVDYESVIQDICDKSGIPHKITLSVLPLRLFMGEGEIVYKTDMLKTLKRFCFQSKDLCNNPVSDEEFIEILRACSEDGFVDYEHRLLTIQVR